MINKQLFRAVKHFATLQGQILLVITGDSYKSRWSAKLRVVHALNISSLFYGFNLNGSERICLQAVLRFIIDPVLFSLFCQTDFYLAAFLLSRKILGYYLYSFEIC